MTTELVTALLVAPVLPGRPQEKGDPHDGSPEGEHRGQDEDAGHDPSIPPDAAWKPSSRVKMFTSAPVGVLLRGTRWLAPADVENIYPGVAGMEAGRDGESGS